MLLDQLVPADPLLELEVGPVVEEIFESGQRVDEIVQEAGLVLQALPGHRRSALQHDQQVHEVFEPVQVLPRGGGLRLEQEQRLKGQDLDAMGRERLGCFRHRTG